MVYYVQSKYDKAILLKYLVIPKHTSYQRILNRKVQKSNLVNLNKNVLGFPRIGNDQPYVCRALLYFFKYPQEWNMQQVSKYYLLVNFLCFFSQIGETEDMYTTLLNFVDKSFLDRIRAEAQLLNGQESLVSENIETLINIKGKHYVEIFKG